MYALTNRIHIVILAASAAAVSACGGGSSEAAVIQRPVEPVATETHARGDRTASGTFDEAGGTLSIGNGARLNIPRGALDDEINLTMSVAEQTRAFANRDDIKTIGPAVLVMPGVESEGPTFTYSIPMPAIPEGFGPEHLTLAFETVDEHQRGAVSHSTQTYWEYSDATETGGRATAEVPFLPGQRFQFVVSQ